MRLTRLQVVTLNHCGHVRLSNIVARGICMLSAAVLLAFSSRIGEILGKPILDVSHHGVRNFPWKQVSHILIALPLAIWQRLGSFQA